MSEPPPRSTPRSTNIVLIEDDEIDVMNVRRAFVKGRIDNPLYVASNGIEGLDLLRSGDVPEDRRLVLLDLNMPKMNGVEFLIELRADPKLRPTPVVVLTTSDDERDRRAAYGLNVAGYLLKPVGSESFCQLMAALDAYWSRVEWP
jgi:CheY-like chemotaxis protein